MVNMNGLMTKDELNILPLGSYDVLIGMEWLESHKVIINCLEKTFTYVNDKGENNFVKVIPKFVSVKKISTVQLNKCTRKGCELFVFHITETKQLDQKPSIEDLSVINKSWDVFPKEIVGLPPKRDRFYH